MPCCYTFILYNNALGSKVDILKKNKKAFVFRQKGLSLPNYYQMQWLVVLPCICYYFENV